MRSISFSLVLVVLIVATLIPGFLLRGNCKNYYAEEALSD